MDLGRLSWRGIVDVEADRVALRDEEGAPHDIRDLFVDVDAIASVRERTVEIGGGIRHTVLTWDGEQDETPTDDQVPGLASLRYLEEDRAPKQAIAPSWRSSLSTPQSASLSRIGIFI